MLPIQRGVNGMCRRVALAQLASMPAVEEVIPDPAARHGPERRRIANAEGAIAEMGAARAAAAPPAAAGAASAAAAMAAAAAPAVRFEQSDVPGESEAWCSVAIDIEFEATNSILGRQLDRQIWCTQTRGNTTL